MCDEGTARHPLESGGILLGWRLGNNRVVIDVSGPGRKPYTAATASFPTIGGKLLRFIGSSRKLAAISTISAIGTRTQMESRP